MGRILRISLKISSAVLLFFGVILFATMRTRTKPFLDKHGSIVVGSVAEQRYLLLGGVKQWVLLRGKSVQNPILLFLHGGPGMPIHWLFRHFNSDLENHFITVGWDQRGAGKSYSNKIPSASMTVDQFVSDLHELITYLKKRFNQKKVYLVGASWGSFLGILYTQKYPENIEAYISIGQATHQKEAERLGYEYALEQAKKHKIHEAIAQLLQLKQPICSNIDDVSIQRKWVLRFGGSLYNKISYLPLIIKMLSIDEYAWPDLIKLWLGMRFTQKLLWPEIFYTNFFKQITELKVPVYFLLGAHDYVISTKLAKQYFNQLKAPKKELILFNYSGHNPMFEQPERFNEVLRSIRYGVVIKLIKEKELAFLCNLSSCQEWQILALCNMQEKNKEKGHLQT